MIIPCELVTIQTDVGRLNFTDIARLPEAIK